MSSFSVIAAAATGCKRNTPPPAAAAGGPAAGPAGPAGGGRLAGAALGDAESARIEAYRGASESVLLALAVKELAANLPNIETLVLSPDLVSKALAQLGTGKVTA